MRRKSGGILVLLDDGMIKCRQTGGNISLSQCRSDKCGCFYKVHGHRRYKDGKYRYETTGILCAYMNDEDRETEERMRKIFVDLICPDCGSKLLDRTIKEGSHKGHGSIICPNCPDGKHVKVWI